MIVCISNPKKVDGDGIIDSKDRNPLKYDITDYTLALVSRLAYNNLENSIGKSLRRTNIPREKIENLENWVVIEANNSGKSDNFWDIKKFFKDKGEDFFDSGFGAVCITNGSDIIYALRGTDFQFGTQVISDGATDVLAFLVDWNNQLSFARDLYKSVCSRYEKYTYFITGHSLGGRLAQDVTLYSINENISSIKSLVKLPKHTATFNALGYSKMAHYINKKFISKYLNNKELIELANSIITNYYIIYDEVGDLAGDSLLYKRYGKNVGYKIGGFLHLLIAYHGLEYFIDREVISDDLKQKILN